MMLLTYTGPQQTVRLVCGLAALEKALIRGHHRASSRGRKGYVTPYFTSTVPEGHTTAMDRPQREQAEEPGASGMQLSPEQLASRLVARVKQGRLTAEDALVQLRHLAERATGGRGITHGPGDRWTPDEVHHFVAYARAQLQDYQKQDTQERSTPVSQRRR